MIKAGRYYIRPNRISPINLKQADIENLVNNYAMNLFNTFNQATFSLDSRSNAK